MRVKIWSVVLNGGLNGGNGSAWPVFFASEAEAIAYDGKEQANNPYYEGFCEQPTEHELEFSDNGELLNPYKGE